MSRLTIEIEYPFPLVLTQGEIHQRRLRELDESLDPEAPRANAPARRPASPAPRTAKARRTVTPTSPVIYQLALAHLLARLLDEGVVPSLAAAARAMKLTRARVTQLVNLTLLAPDLQEAILFGRIQCSERTLRRCLRSMDWGAQRRALAPYRRRVAGRAFRYTTDQRREILRQLDSSTETIEEFAFRLGIPKNSIHRWRHREKVARGAQSTVRRWRGIGPRVRPVEERIAVVREFLSSGLTQSEFCRRQVVNRRTLCGWVRKFRECGMSAEERRRIVRRRIYSPAERARMIAEVEATGASARSVALKHGVSSTCLNTWLRARNRGPTNDARDAPTVLLRGS